MKNFINKFLKFLNKLIIFLFIFSLIFTVFLIISTVFLYFREKVSDIIGLQVMWGLYLWSLVFVLNYGDMFNFKHHFARYDKQNSKNKYSILVDFFYLAVSVIFCIIMILSDDVTEKVNIFLYVSIAFSIILIILHIIKIIKILLKNNIKR